MIEASRHKSNKRPHLKRRTQTRKTKSFSLQKPTLRNIVFQIHQCQDISYNTRDKAAHLFATSKPSLSKFYLTVKSELKKKDKILTSLALRHRNTEIERINKNLLTTRTSRTKSCYAHVMHKKMKTQQLSLMSRLDVMHTKNEDSATKS